MSELIEINSSQLESLSNDQLLAELKNSLDMTVYHIQKMAVVWNILSNRGVDLSRWKQGLMEFLPQIAAGRLNPEALTKYAGQRNLILTLSRLPNEIQGNLISSGKIQKLDIFNDQDEIISDVELSDLRNVDLAQLFKETDIRSISEQRIYLLTNSIVKNKEPKQRKKTFRKVEVDGNYLSIGNDSQVSLDAVIAELSKTYEIDLKAILGKNNNL